jgi:hypothetical protein
VVPPNFPTNSLTAFLFSSIRATCPAHFFLLDLLIHSPMILEPFVGPWPLCQFRNPVHSQYDSLDGGSARRKASTFTQDNTNAINADIDALNGVRTHDPSVRRQFMRQTARPLITLTKSASYEAPHYVISSILLLFPPSSAQATKTWRLINHKDQVHLLGGRDPRPSKLVASQFSNRCSDFKASRVILFIKERGESENLAEQLERDASRPSLIPHWVMLPAGCARARVLNHVHGPPCTCAITRTFRSKSHETYVR